MKDKIIKRLHTLGIAELTEITSLNELSGDYINLECKLPNGSRAIFLMITKSTMGIRLKRKMGTDVMALPQITNNLPFLNMDAME